MAAHLRLVANTDWFLEADAGYAVTDIAKLDNLLLMPAGDFKTADTPKPAYKILAAVIVIHVAVIAGMLITRPDAKVQEKTITPMMVSLVNVPSVTETPALPEPEQVKPVQVKPAVVKQQKPVAKQRQEQPVQPVTETATSHPVESKAAEQPVVAEAAAAENPVKTEQPAQVAEATAKADAPAEPVIEPPRFGAAYLNNPAPTYPPSARRLGEQGRVLLKVLVSENGMAETVQLDTSSGYEKLDRAAIEAVKRWSFIPAKRSNQPVSAYVLVPIKFALNS